MMRVYFALARGDRDGGEATLRRADADAQVVEQPLCRRMILARLGQAVLLRGDPDGARHLRDPADGGGDDRLVVLPLRRVSSSRHGRGVDG